MHVGTDPHACAICNCCEGVDNAACTVDFCGSVTHAMRVLWVSASLWGNTVGRLVDNIIFSAGPKQHKLAADSAALGKLLLTLLALVHVAGWLCC